MKMLQVVVGVVIVLAGLLFFLQGINVLGGSGMSGKALWAVLGPIIAIVGAVIVVRALRAPAPAEDF